VARLLGLVFGLGVQMAAPILAVLVVVELALGLLSRGRTVLQRHGRGVSDPDRRRLLTLAATLPLVPMLVSRSIPAVLELGTRLAETFR